jgi:hypothetical protein
MSQRAARPGGHSTRSGRKFVRKDDGIPSAREVRQLTKRLGASTRRGRCGRPGRAPTPEYRQHVLEKLRAASQERGGKGIRFLSRDELDAILSMIDDARARDAAAPAHEDAALAPTETPTAPTETPTAPTETPTAPTETPTAPTETPIAPTEAPTS